jgi:hypothetical protein
MPSSVLVRPTLAAHAEYYSNYMRLVPGGSLVGSAETRA